MISNFEVNIRHFVRESLTEEEEGIINLAIDKFFFESWERRLGIKLLFNSFLEVFRKENLETLLVDERSR